MKKLDPDFIRKIHEFVPFVANMTKFGVKSGIRGENRDVESNILAHSAIQQMAGRHQTKTLIHLLP